MIQANEDSTTQDRGAEGAMPIRLSPAALRAVLDLRSASPDPAAALRLDLAGRGAGQFQYAFGLVDVADRDADDLALDQGEGLTLLVNRQALPDLEGTVIDYLQSNDLAGFRIENPNPLWRDPLAAAVQAVLDRDINPGLATHGGGVSLLGVDEDQAFVELWGGCQGCAAARMTLKLGIERQIRAALPQIRAVVDRTDHAGGANPYYRDEAGASPEFGSGAGSAEVGA